MAKNKYIRTIYSTTSPDSTGMESVEADVYEVLEAFNVTCPARQHAIKKLLCSGIRGKGDASQDLREAREAIFRAEHLEDRRVKLAKATELVDNLRGAAAPALDPALVKSSAETLRTIGEATDRIAEGANNVRGGQRKGAKAGGQSRKRPR